MYARRLEHLGIVTVEDLLFYIPFRYDDYRVLSKIQMLQPGEVVTVQGKVLEIKNQYTRSRKTIQKAILVDDTGEIELTWFNQPFLTRVINPNDILAVSGRVEKRNQTLSMLSPEYEVVRSESGTLHTGRLVPVYSETKGITSKWIRRQVHKVLEMYATDIDEYLPEEIIAKHRFLSLQQAIRTIHFPKTLDEVAAARKRIAFDELFLLQLKAVQRKETWKKNTVGIPFVLTSYQTKLEKFIDSLPFTLTSAQQKAVDAITQDLTKKEPMNRLLQGDVGSGKTVVSTIAMYLSYLNGYQSVLMAPTEILAQQHYTTISKLLTQFGVKVDLVTGSIKYLVSGIKKKKENIQNTKYQIQDTHVLVGTHAVLSEKIIFDKLGLVVIDEQQRFGVEQRSIIREKGKNPHLLTMTATPIPRTVALTMYGDLDLSYLDEMPKGRQMIKTWLVPQEKRDSAYVWIRKQVKETDSQIFIICPFIEESESMQTVKAATKEFERLAKDIFPDLKLGMLHGRLKGKEKDAILDKFRQKEFDILAEEWESKTAGFYSKKLFGQTFGLKFATQKAKTA